MLAPGNKSNHVCCFPYVVLTISYAQNFVLVFSCPVTTACCFTARVEPVLPNCADLLRRAPDIARPGAGLRCTRGGACAWETVELEDQHTVVHPQRSVNGAPRR